MLPDVVFSKFLGDALGEADDSSLGSRIVGLVGVSNFSKNTGNVHNRPSKLWYALFAVH